MNSLASLFVQAAEENQHLSALRFRKNNQWHTVHWHEWRQMVRDTALGLHALGISCGDKIAILSENSPEWTFADLGALSLGAVTVPIYPTASPQDIAYVLRHAEVKILFVSNSQHLERLNENLKDILGNFRIILFQENTGSGCENLAFLQELGRKTFPQAEEVFINLVDQVSPESLASLIYTSGTTGPPKGVMLTHKNFVSNYESCKKRIQVSSEDVALSFLPLCHVFERLAGYYFMAFQGAQIAYAESMQTLARDFVEVKPTVAASVPRVYEKIYAAIMETLSQKPKSIQNLFHWAVSLGKKCSEKKLKRQSLSLWEKIQWKIADQLVFKKIKGRFGGQVRLFISGGAPLSKELAEFFYAIGVLILEGYGLTETSPVISVNTADHLKFGSVGQPLPGVQVKIAEDDEILTKSDSVMKGYFKDEESTKKVIQAGWLHTGDIGYLSQDGFLVITDRKKDIIVNAGGKNISPQNIEKAILADPLFAQVVIIGDKRPFLTALILLQRSGLEKLCVEMGLGSPGWEKALEDPRIYEAVNKRLQTLTCSFAQYEKIQYFAFLPEELSIASGELTPTLKVKRRFVMQKYHGLIDKLYQSAGAAAKKL